MPEISIRGIGQPTPSGSSITDAWVTYKGARTTEVPAGEPFQIWARGIANIPGQISAEVLFTAKGGNIAQFDTTDVGPFGGPTYDSGNTWLKFNQQGQQSDPIMPSQNLTLTIKLWGNSARGQAIPPISQW